MKKIIQFTILLGLFSGCASTKQFAKLPVDDTNKDLAKIYVIRPSNYAFSVKVKIYENDNLVGKIGPKSYLYWEVDPANGNVEIMSKAENKDAITISPKVGETYYIKQKMKTGILKARTEITLLSETEAKELLPDLKAPELQK